MPTPSAWRLLIIWETLSRCDPAEPGPVQTRLQRATMGQTGHPESRSQAVSCHLGLDASVFCTVCCPRAHFARLLALHMPKWVSGHIHAYSQQ